VSAKLCGSEDAEANELRLEELGRLLSVLFRERIERKGQGERDTAGLTYLFTRAIRQADIHCKHTQHSNTLVRAVGPGVYTRRHKTDL